MPSFFHRNKKAAAEQRVCQSCYLLGSDHEEEQGKKQPKFVDEDRCSSCNVEDDDGDYLASAGLLREDRARREWWYADLSSRGSSSQQDKDTEAKELDAVVPGKRSRRSSIFGWWGRNSSGSVATTAHYQLVAGDEEVEEGDGEDDNGQQLPPPALLRRQDAFALIGEDQERLVEFSTRDDVPSILVCMAQSTTKEGGECASWYEPTDLPSPSCLSPPVLSLP